MYQLSFLLIPVLIFPSRFSLLVSAVLPLLLQVGADERKSLNPRVVGGLVARDPGGGEGSSGKSSGIGSEEGEGRVEGHTDFLVHGDDRSSSGKETGMVV